MVKGERWSKEINKPRTLYIPKYPRKKEIRKKRIDDSRSESIMRQLAFKREETAESRFHSSFSVFNDTTKAILKKAIEDSQNHDHKLNDTTIEQAKENKHCLISLKNNIAISSNKVNTQPFRRSYDENSMFAHTEGFKVADHNPSYFKKLLHRKFDDLKTFWAKTNKLFPHVFKTKRIQNQSLNPRRHLEERQDLAFKQIFNE